MMLSYSSMVRADELLSFTVFAVNEVGRIRGWGRNRGVVKCSEACWRVRAEVRGTVPSSTYDWRAYRHIDFSTFYNFWYTQGRQFFEKRWVYLGSGIYNWYRAKECDTSRPVTLCETLILECCWDIGIAEWEEVSCRSCIPACHIQNRVKCNPFLH